MKYSSLIFFLLLTLCNTTRAEVNYIDYHKKIIVAERYFLNGDFSGSIEKYKNVFKEYNKPFAKDCFIAAQIACLKKDTVSAQYFLEVAFVNGLNWGLLNQISTVHEILLNSHSYEQNLRKIYALARAKYIRSIDTLLRHKVREMILNDGYYKISVSQKYRNESADTAHWRVGDSLYADCLDKNIIELQKIIKKHGYPGEHLIGGLDDEIGAYPDKTTGQSGDNPVYSTVTSMPAVMYYHHEYGYQLMSKELLDAVRKGELNPREYAMMHEWSYNSIKKRELYTVKFSGDPAYKTTYNFLPYKLRCEVVPRSCRYNFYKDPDYYTKDVVLVDKCREEIGMCNLLHDKLKKQFEKKYTLKLYFGIFNNI